MTNVTPIVPSFGTYTAKTYRKGTEEAVWGARLIAPADLLHDRQDLVSTNDDAKTALIRWLNGDRGDGAIQKALDKLRERMYAMGLDGASANSAVIYEDEQGMIVGSCQESFGYVYVTGWLKV